MASVLRWWRAPLWLIGVFSGAKSFADNPILGSQRLNRAGLHVWRLKAAHRMASGRRARLARSLPQEWREQFDRDGFVVVPDFLPPEAFHQLRADLFDAELESRAQQQGDTVTRRVPVGPALLRRFPALDALLKEPRWRGLMAYVGSSRSEPLYYIQTISAGVAEGAPDPQLQLHSDTFHPSLKAWLFLTDVTDGDRPLTYVPGSHRLTPQRIAWEQRKSVHVLSGGDRLSQRGSFRLAAEELPALGLPRPRRFCVPANTLVAADTCGFHARGDSDGPSIRVELWAYSRRTPLLPWVSGGPTSWWPIAPRRADWLLGAVDWLDRRGWMKQHWQPAGKRRPIDP